jgi:mycoredoxin
MIIYSMKKVNDTITTIIKVYGADWCGDCLRAKFILDANEIKYEYIDVDINQEAKEYVIRVNPNGYRSIPVIVFINGDILIEPSTGELLKKLESSTNTID